MCGRFTREYSWAQLQAYFNLINIVPESDFQPRYNICPTTTIDAIVGTPAGRSLVPMRWGIIPAWWSKPLKDMRLATFNARAETVESNAMFGSAFKRNRCIIPASGYYEWQTIGKEKQPHYFTLKDGLILSIAGIWDPWINKESGEVLRSCAMIITEPNKMVAGIHDRMPVLLQPRQFNAWLSGASGKEVLYPAPDDLLQRWAVSKRVNSSRASDIDETLIERLS